MRPPESQWWSRLRLLPPTLGSTFGEFCLSHRAFILAVVVLVTVFAAAQLPKMRTDHSLGAWFQPDDPDLLAHYAISEQYGNDEYILVALQAPDVFTVEILTQVDRLTRALAEAPFVEKVFSLTRVDSVTGSGDLLEVGELVPFPLDPASIPGIRERALSNELYVGNLVNATGDFTVILARLPFLAASMHHHVEAVEVARTILASEQGRTAARVFLAGDVPMNVEILEMTERDVPMTVGAMTVMLVLFLGFLFRSISGVLIPLVTVGIAVLWAVGWLFLAGHPLTPITQSLPPIMLAVAVADSVHLIVEYLHQLHAGLDRRAALIQTYQRLFWPCLLTSLTTCIGFYSLSVSEVKTVHELGVYAALGVFGAFLLSVTLVPIALSVFPPPRRRSGDTSAHHVSRQMLGWAYGFALAHGRAILVCFAVLLVGAVVAITQMRIEAGMLAHFKDDQPFKIHTREIEASLSGASTLQVVLDTGVAGGMKDPAALSLLEGLQRTLLAHPEVDAAYSLPAVLKDLRRAFFDNDPEAYRLPETREEAAQYLLLYEMDEPDGDLYEYTDYTYRQARLTARVTSEHTGPLAEIVDDADAYLRDHVPPGYTVTLGGNARLWANMETYILRSLLLGFGMAFSCIYGLFCLQLRSMLLAAIAMIPNVVPPVLCLGVMGLSGVPLDTATVMVASITLGLAVDNTIHFMSHTIRDVDEGYSLEHAIERTTREVGRAMLFTSLALAAAFGILMLGSYVGVSRFGLLCLFTIAVALPADLLLLPAVLRWYAHRRRPEWVHGKPQNERGPAAHAGAPLPDWAPSVLEAETEAPGTPQEQEG